MPCIIIMYKYIMHNALNIDFLHHLIKLLTGISNVPEFGKLVGYCGPSALFRKCSPLIHVIVRAYFPNDSAFMYKWLYDPQPLFRQNCNCISLGPTLLARVDEYNWESS